MPRHMRLLKFLLLPLLVAPLMGQAAPVYSIATVGSIGGNSSNPSALNNAGQVAGYAYDASSVPSAFVSSGGAMSNLHPAGATSSYAWGINNAGVATGQVDYGLAKSRAVTFSGGAVTDIGSLGDANTSSYGSAINNSGQVAGVSYLAGNTGSFHGFLYTPGSGMLDIGTLGGSNSYGRGINGAGGVVGYADLSGNNYHAFHYDAGGMTDLGTLGGTASDAYSVNSSGTTVGLSWIAGDLYTHAFVYAGGIMADIGSLGGLNSYAYGINDIGQVVGGSEYQPAGAAQHAFLYSGGIMIDLNTLIDPASGWNLMYAVAINDKHQIAASGCNRAGECQALLLTLNEVDPGPSQVPEPATGSMLLLGMGMLGLLRRGATRK